MERIVPGSIEQAAAALAGAAETGAGVRIAGAGTKREWGRPVDEPALELASTGLDQVVEHNASDLTAILEAGVPLAQAQAAFAAEGQMLALDPALGVGRDRSASIGGVLATGDCGPLRHRYGQPRDLVLGMTVALSDGTVARSGSKVIKNVAGYDIAKLFCGSFGTLGMILSASVRLHPIPVLHTTAMGTSGDPDALTRAALSLARAPLELESLDVAWSGGTGGILARVGGAEAVRRGERIAALMREHALEDVGLTEQDEQLWARQRAGQRARPGQAIVCVATLPSALAAVLRAVRDAGGTLVGRAALGSSYVELEPAAVSPFRTALPAGAHAVLLDGPGPLRDELDPWGPAASLDLMRALKSRFDPARACNPGVFVGGI